MIVILTFSLVLVLNQAQLDILPPCPCGKAKARYICMEPDGHCKGTRYFCEEFCMTKPLHNHLPEKITELVNACEIMWTNLMTDLSSVRNIA